MPLSESDPRATAVLVYEFNARNFERPTNCLNSGASGLACICFELVHGDHPHLSALSELLLTPFQ